MHDARAGLRRPGVGTVRRRRDQRLDELMPEACDPITCHVAADHAFGEPWLERLIDDAAAPAEIRLAALHKASKRELLGNAAALRVQHTYDVVAFVARHALDFPHALSGVAATLLEDTRARRGEPRRKFRSKCDCVAIAVSVATPAEM